MRRIIVVLIAALTLGALSPAAAKKQQRQPRSYQDILKELHALEWERPERSGLEIDKWYTDADSIFAQIRDIENRISFYTLQPVASSTDTIIAPVDKDGNIRHRGETWSQVINGSLYATELSARVAALGTATALHAVQIGQDAIPGIGNKQRKKANTQIAKLVKIFPLIKELTSSQYNLFKRYNELNYIVTGNNDAVQAMEDIGVDFANLNTMPDDELEAYIQAQQG